MRSLPSPQRTKESRPGRPIKYLELLGEALLDSPARAQTYPIPGYAKHEKVRTPRRRTSGQQPRTSPPRLRSSSPRPSLSRLARPRRRAPPCSALLRRARGMSGFGFDRSNQYMPWHPLGDYNCYLEFMRRSLNPIAATLGHPSRPQKTAGKPLTMMHFLNCSECFVCLVPQRRPGLLSSSLWRSTQKGCVVIKQIKIPPVGCPGLGLDR